MSPYLHSLNLFFSHLPATSDAPILRIRLLNIRITLFYCREDQTLSIDRRKKNWMSTLSIFFLRIYRILLLYGLLEDMRSMKKFTAI